jgi:hypothetical protein
MEAGDVGSVGDRVPGNAIFDANGNCAFFRGSGSGSAQTTTAATVPVVTTPAPVATHTSFGVRDIPRFSGGVKGALIICLLFSLLHY